jgi:predicted Zn-dependent protease
MMPTNRTSAVSGRGIFIPLFVLWIVAFPAAAHLDLEIQIANVGEAIALDPANASLYLKRGELHRAHSDWPAAEADFLQARKLDPKMKAVDFYLGRLKLDAGKPKEAKRILDRLLADMPDHADALIVRARAEIELGQPDAGTRDFNAALATLEESGRAQPTYYLERARAFVDLDKVDLALSGLDQGLEHLGQPVTLQLYAIELELQQGRHDEAMKRLERIAAQSPRKETWLIRRGEILEQAGRPDDARKAYTAALAAIETLPDTRRWNRAVQKLEASAEEALTRLNSTSQDPATAEAPQ